MGNFQREELRFVAAMPAPARLPRKSLVRNPFGSKIPTDHGSGTRSLGVYFVSESFSQGPFFFLHSLTIIDHCDAWIIIVPFLYIQSSILDYSFRTSVITPLSLGQSSRQASQV